MTTNDSLPAVSARTPSVRTTERDIAMWRLYCGGTTQDAIARRYGVSQPTVHRAIRRVRDSIPVDSRTELIQREVAFLERMREEMINDFEASPPPAFDQKGNALEDPRTGELVRDLSTRMAAWDRAVRSHERLAKLLGLDAPSSSKVDVDQRTEVRYVLQIEGFTVEDLR